MSENLNFNSLKQSGGIRRRRNGSIKKSTPKKVSRKTSIKTRSKKGSRKASRSTKAMVKKTGSKKPSKKLSKKRIVKQKGGNGDAPEPVAAAAAAGPVAPAPFPPAGIVNLIRSTRRSTSLESILQALGVRDLPIDEIIKLNTEATNMLITSGAPGMRARDIVVEQYQDGRDILVSYFYRTEIEDVARFLIKRLNLKL